MIEVATLKTKRHLAWWLIPLASLLLAITLGATSWTKQGVEITLQFEQGYGVQPGSSLKYRGIAVGMVESVLLMDEALEGIKVTVRLTPEARHIASKGSVFWVNRAEVGISGVSGLDALVGATYINVLPGKGEAQYRFVGVGSAPLNSGLEPGGIEVTLQAERMGGLRAGAPVRYRQITIGKVMTIGLSSDASAVEAQVYIQPKYLNLVRSGTHFWQSGGISATAGLSGFSLKVDSLTNAVLGGVALAVPEKPGHVVHQGHRFKLHDEVKPSWLTWRPSVPLGNPLLPDSVALPELKFAVLRWKESSYGVMESDEQRQGWLLAYEGGWLGPNDLMQLSEDALQNQGQLEVAGEVFTITNKLADKSHLLWLKSADDKLSVNLVSGRQSLGPEDIVIVRDEQALLRQVSASRIVVDEGYWQLDPMLVFGSRWHGAAVLSAKDGKLLGQLSVQEEGDVQVLLMPVSIPK
ncbi:MAG: MCE family protein [Methylococcales bacterium]|jgi:paraquat-inducible protein B|nr:MCE family protein [Methylococcales bacterium]